MKLKTILIAALIGGIAGVGLEIFNIYLVYPSAPVGVLLILMIVLAAGLGMLVQRREDRRRYSLDQLPVAVAVYIDLVVRKMRYRRKIRREVRHELATHFEDALAQCQNDGEREDLSRKLIAEFGDGRMLAALIRRGKKRCRSLWRKAVVCGLQGVGILILFFVVYSVWFITGEPRIRVDYVAKWNELTRPKAPEAQNAWPYYERAIDLYVEPDEEIEKVIKDRGRVAGFEELAEDERTVLLEWLEKNRRHLDDLEPRFQGTLRRYVAHGVVPIVRKADSAVESKYRHFYTTPSRALESILETVPRERGVPLLVPIDNETPGRMAKEELQDEFMTLIEEHELELLDFSHAVAVVVLEEWIDRTRGRNDSPVARLDAYEWRVLWQWIEDNEEAWRHYVAGSRMAYCHREYDKPAEGESLYAILLPHLSSLRSSCRVGVWRSRLAAADGRLPLALANCMTIVRAGRHWQIEETTLVEQLVGLSLVRLGLSELLSTISRHDVSSTDLQRCHQELLETYADGFPPMGVMSEKLHLLDLVQRTFSEGGPGGGHMLPREIARSGVNDWYFVDEPYVNEGVFLAATMVHAGRDETLALVDKLFAMTESEVGMNPYELRNYEGTKVDNAIMAIPQHRFWLVRMLMPALSRAGELGFRGKAAYEATLTVLALKRWRLAKGRYPDRLDELVTGRYLHTLPDDPYGPGALTYERRGDDFVLYSLAADFDDDGGQDVGDHRWGEDEGGGDHVFWPVQ